MPDPSVLAVIDRLEYPNWWRVLWPFNELRKHGYSADCWRYEDLRSRSLEPYDVILTPRLSFGGDHWLTDWLAKARHNGKTWIWDSDDDLWSPDWLDRQVYATGRGAERAERRRMRHAFERQRQDIVRILGACDGVTVATAELARRLSRQAEVVPDMIDTEWFERKAKLSRRVAPGLTVGWAGGGRLPSDFEPLPRAWSRIAAMHPEVMFVVYGVDLDVLVGAVPPERVVAIDWSTVQAYPAGLKNIDIMCCVLPATNSNLGKSAIKWMEATLAGAVCVASPTVYGGVVCHEETALVAESEDEWVVALDTLIRTPELRRQLVQAANVEVRERHALNANWHRWPKAWNDIRAMSI